MYRLSGVSPITNLLPVHWIMIIMFWQYDLYGLGLCNVSLIRYDMLSSILLIDIRYVLTIFYILSLNRSIQPTEIWWCWAAISNKNIVLFGKCPREWLAQCLLNRKSLEFSCAVTISHLRKRAEACSLHVNTDVFNTVHCKRDRFLAFFECILSKWISNE